MKSNLDIQITTYMGIGLFVAMGFFQRWSDIFSIAADAVGSAIMLRFVYRKWLWKWEWLRVLERIHRTPYLEGKWRGEFESSGNENTLLEHLKKRVDVEIRQPDIGTIKIARKSKESTSQSYAEGIEVGSDGITHLTYSYISTPLANVRDRSPISYGTARLALFGDSRSLLEGSYWTDQRTTGVIKLRKIQT